MIWDGPGKEEVHFKQDLVNRGYVCSVAGIGWWKSCFVSNISWTSILCKLTEVKPNPSLSWAWPILAPACFYDFLIFRFLGLEIYLIGWTKDILLFLFFFMIFRVWLEKYTMLNIEFYVLRHLFIFDSWISRVKL